MHQTIRFVGRKGWLAALAIVALAAWSGEASAQRPSLAGLPAQIDALRDQVGASPTCQPITGIPTTLVEPGVYCLRHHSTNSSSSGTMIEISADNVTLDLGGWTLDGSGAGHDTIATGISAFNRKNITVQNGTVRGFRTAIDLTQGSGHVVTRVRAEGNTQFGIVIKSAGSLIHDNLILNTGGSTAGSVFEVPAGILMQSPRTQVSNNQVINTNGTSISYGIYVGPNSNGTVVQNNRVSNPQVQGDVTSYGISVVDVVFASQDIAISNNHVARMTKCINYDPGSTGIYANNIVLGCSTPFAGGTAAGSTNFSQ